MSAANMPTLIVEAALNVGASTSGFWTIGDPVRGAIGTFVLGPDQVFTDITSYVQAITCTAGSSSRVSNPLVQFEAGTLTLALNNLTRAFDPLNTTSPFYSNGSSIIIPVPGTIPNADPALGAGTAYDAQVLSVSTGVTNAPADFAGGSGSAFNATVTGTTTGNTPTGMLFGSSPGSGWTTTTTLLHPRIARTFENQPTSYSNTGQAKNVAANVQQFISFKYSPTTLANTSDANFASTVTDAKKTLSGLSDIKDHWCANHHEPQGDNVQQGGTETWTIAEWQQSQINFRNYVVDPVNATRTNPIFFANPMNGYLSPAQANVWFTNAVLNVMDAVGWDCYGYNTGQDQALAGHNYAKSKGMRLIIPEIGSMVQGTASSTTDAQELAVMQSVMGHITNDWSGDDRPIAVCWFNGNSSAVNSKPNAATYWKNVCDNSSVAP